MGGFPAESVPISIAPISAANVLDGFVVQTSTQAAATVITVPAGRTWIGQILVSAAVSVAAAVATAGESRGVVSVAGAGSTPAAGTLFEVGALVGANAAAGLTGDGDNNSGALRAVVIAPAGNAVTVQLTTTVSGTAGRVACACVGELQ